MTGVQTCALPISLGPKRCAQLVEDLERPLQRLSRGALLSATPLDGPEHEVGAPELERLAQALVQAKRALERRNRPRHVSLRGAEEAPAAARRHERPSTLKPPPLFLQLIQKTLCLLQLPEGDQGFDRVAVETEERRLPEARLGDVLAQRAEEAVSVGELPQRELEKAADRPQLEVGEDDAHAQRERQPFVGGRPGRLDPAEVCSNESSNRESERTLDFLAALGRCLVRLLGVTTRH